MKTDLPAALRGISGVHVTPYDSEGEIDAAMLARVVERIAAAGVHGVVSGGNTGEFYALTADELRLAHDTALAANAGRAALIAGVGRSLREAIALGRRAAQGGADAAMVHQPADPFMAPQAQADYFRTIAEALPIPVVAYLRSDVPTAPEVLSIADHPNVAGVKFASRNLMRLAECLRLTGPQTAQWVCGLAEGWAPMFYAAGVRGFTSGLVNLVPERSLAIHAALEAGDYAGARAGVAAIAPFEAMRARYHDGANVTVVKAALAMTGWPMGGVRLPGLPALSASEGAELAAILRGWGLSPA